MGLGRSGRNCHRPAGRDHPALISRGRCRGLPAKLSSPPSATHHILVFHDHDLSRDEQLAFTRQFGEIEEHVARHSAAARYDLVHAVTNVGDDGQPTTKFSAVGNDHWHTDKSYHAVPSLMTLLHAKELRPEDGDTEFANMAMAYETLPEG